MLAQLIIPSIPMGLGIAADVFGITLIISILFPEAFKEFWVHWLFAVGGGHALLPMVGQFGIIYLGPVLEDWFGLSPFVVETCKTLATAAGCYFLWFFLKGVFEGVVDPAVEAFTGLTVAAWWGCTADAAYSGAAKAANALEYNWGLTEIIVSNIIAALIVMVVCGIAIYGGLNHSKKFRKPGWQVLAFYLEFVILGYFLVFFAITRAAHLWAYATETSFNQPLEGISILISVGFVTALFATKWADIWDTQTQRLTGNTIVFEEA